MKYIMTLIFLLLPAYVDAAPTASDCDFNNSGKVDFADFIAFSQGYGTTQPQFDLNGDGAVNFRDFIVFAQFYGQTVTPPPPTTNAPVGIQVGMQAPDFTLNTLTGERFNLYEQRGKPVFLNFWGAPQFQRYSAMQIYERYMLAKIESNIRNLDQALDLQSSSYADLFPGIVKSIIRKWN